MVSGQGLRQSGIVVGTLWLKGTKNRSKESQNKELKEDGKVEGQGWETVRVSKSISLEVRNNRDAVHGLVIRNVKLTRLSWRRW